MSRGQAACHNRAVTQRSPSPGPVVLVVLAGLGMVGPFSIDTVFPAFAQMSRALDVSDFALQQLLSAYLVAFAVMSLFHGPISDAVGRRRVIVAGLLVYAAASAASALAPSFGVLVALRAVQGASAGAGQIISRAMVSDLYEGHRAQRVMSHIAMIFGLAPALAPVVGGWLLLVGDWRLIYWFLTLLGVVLVALTVFFLPESHPAESRTPLQPRQLLRSVWSVWRDRDGRRLALAGMFNFAGMFTFISAAPLFVVGLMGGGEQDFWTLFLPLIGGMVAGSFVSGRLAGYMAPRGIASLGYRISLAGGLLNLILALLPFTQGMPWAVAALPVYTFGIALAFPILTLEMLQLFPQSRGAASSVQSFVQLSFNAIIAGAIAPLAASSVVGLGATALGFTLIGWLGWRRHVSMTEHA